MNKHILRQLIVESYTEDELDPAKVSKIADVLTRTELKEYIKALKEQEKKTTVVLTVPEGMEHIELKPFEGMFPNKKIVLERQPDAILGVKVRDNDTIYDFTLRNTLEKMVEYIEEKYD